jgi:hypothetical protein
MSKGARVSDSSSASEHLDVPNSIRDINNLFYEKGWTDGLPIIPPTEDAVADMLRFTDYGPNDVVCQRAAERHAGNRRAAGDQLRDGGMSAGILSRGADRRAGGDGG